MSVEAERVYTINLGKVLLSQSQHRAVRAINMIREFARRHMKAGDVRIDEELAQQVWARGVRRPPRRIRVRMSKTDAGHIMVSLYDGMDEPVPGEPAAGAAGADAGQALQEALREATVAETKDGGEQDVRGPAAESPGDAGPEKEPAAKEAGPAEEPAAEETGPSKEAPAEPDTPAKEAPAAEEPAAEETGPPKEAPAADGAGPAKDAPAGGQEGPPAEKPKE